VDFDITSLLLIRYSAFVRYWREVLYNIKTEFGIPMKLVRLIKMCLNETYSEVCKDKNLSDTFPIQNGLKQDALSPMISTVL